MIQHLFTLIWNRRRANFLLIAEIFLAFVVLFVVGSVVTYNQQNYRQPPGFAYEEVWRVDLDPGALPQAGRLATVREVMAYLRTLPEVVAVGRTASNTPFSGSTNNSTVFGSHDEKGTYAQASGLLVEDDLRTVLQLPLVAGRWFDKRDDAAATPPAVITADLAAQLFPQQSALGHVVRRNDTEHRVVGIVAPMRADNPLSEGRPGILMRVSPQDTAWGEASSMLVRVRPGAGAVLERQMTTQMLRIAKGWTVGITALREERAAQLKRALTPLVGLGLVCAFLIVNVAMGLFGVLWQTINQRRGEIGLRRAIGASAGGISGQVVGEILVVTTFGLALGLLVAVQFPLLHVLEIRPGVYAQAMLLATGLIYALTALCALYPSRLAAGIHPAVALREE